LLFFNLNWYYYEQIRLALKLSPLQFTHLTDQELVQLLQQGDKKAFDALYGRYWRKLYLLAYQKLRSRELAEELVQDLFISLWTKRESLHITASVGAYLGMAVRYMVIKFFQKERVHQQYEQTAALGPAYANTTEDAVLFRDLQEVIEQEINKLPEKCREVFQLSRHDNLSQKEISLKLHLSEKTVENHIGKALRLLRLSLKDFITSVVLLFFMG
jgi:RNA polymerase sigma-70 factor (ECF subfamily)